ncbi:MAG: MFS transporter, partial [Rhodoluna sp.]
MSSVNVDKIQHRTVRVLTVGQVLSGFGLGATLSIGALLAEQISGSAAWSGSAATFSTLGAATWAIPLSRLAYIKGRRVSLATGAAIAITGAFTVITAASLQFFPLLLIGLFFMGSGSAVSLQARFAATDLPSSRNIGRDLSLVVWATTVGAVTGPNMFGPGEIIGNLLHMPKLTGPFVLTVIAQVLAASVFYFGLRPDPLLTSKELSAAKSQKAKTSFKDAFAVIKQYPKAAFAIISIALSQMVMVSVMSMTPVHMKQMGYDLVIVGFTISLHIAGMYAFSPIFGWLSDKLGKIQVVLLGQVIYLSALAIAGFGQHDRWAVTIGLFLLGLGWSASTVSASALLAQTIPAEQKT